METVFRLIIQLLGKSEGNYIAHIFGTNITGSMFFTPKIKKTYPRSIYIRTVFGLKIQLTGQASNIDVKPTLDCTHLV